MDCSPPGSSVHGISQARVLEWGVTDALGQHFSDFNCLRTTQKACQNTHTGAHPSVSESAGLGWGPGIPISNKVPVIKLLGEGNGTPLQYSCLENPMDGGAWKAAVHGVAKSQTGLSDFSFTSHFHALEKEMATHSSGLAWRIPGTGEPDGLPSMGLHRVEHD